MDSIQSLGGNYGAYFYYSGNHCETNGGRGGSVDYWREFNGREKDRRSLSFVSELGAYSRESVYSDGRGPFVSTAAGVSFGMEIIPSRLSLYLPLKVRLSSCYSDNGFDALFPLMATGAAIELKPSPKRPLALLAGVDLAVSMDRYFDSGEGHAFVGLRYYF